MLLFGGERVEKVLENFVESQVDYKKRSSLQWVRVSGDLSLAVDNSF